MLLPCSLQLDLTGQKVIFGITPQLLLFLTCSQTSAAPCPAWHWENCPNLPAFCPSSWGILPLAPAAFGGGLRQPKGISWTSLMQICPSCQPAHGPKTSKPHQGSPMQRSKMCLTHQGTTTWCPKLLCTNPVNPEGQLIPHLPHTPHRSHSHRGISLTAHNHQPMAQTVNTLKIPPLSCEAESKFQLEHLQRIYNRFLSAL